MSDHILSALVDQQRKEDPAAASLLPAFTTPEAVTLELLQARALRQHSTAMPGQRKALAARAWEMHEARCRAIRLDTAPMPSTPAAVQEAPRRSLRKQIPRAKGIPRGEPMEWGGIQVIPIRGDVDRCRLVVDRTLDREWALRLAATICTVLAEVK
jgi:hypothetical protein